MSEQDPDSCIAVLEALDALFQRGTCPQPGCIGEVCLAELSARRPGEWQSWTITTYVWNGDFNDQELVAKVARDAGATDVIIAHVLHDTLNGETGGRTVDGTRCWLITVFLPDVNVETTAAGGKADRPSEPVRGPAGGPAGETGDAAREAKEQHP